MSVSDARHVLAQAMGRAPPPIVPSTAEQFGVPLLWQLVEEPSLENAQLAFGDVRVWRALALLVLLVLLPCIVQLVYKARLRHLGGRVAPVPLDYKALRKRAQALEH